MEFKGTNAPWVWEWKSFDSNKLPCLLGPNGEVMNFGNDYEYYPSEGKPPNKYDALLISKAPEMLYLLKDLLHDKGLNEVSKREVELLIKKSTEIN